MIKIGIFGYGNLGRGVECAIKQNDDLELAAVFTRRNHGNSDNFNRDSRSVPGGRCGILER